MQITDHFSREEFDRPARERGGRLYPAAPYPLAWIQSRLRPLCETLEVIRDAVGARPLRVGSGYRDHEYNAVIGGAKRSQHMEGRAADIVVAGMTAQFVHNTILELFEDGHLPHLGGLGSYPGFTHVDVRPRVAGRLTRWTGSRADN